MYELEFPPPCAYYNRFGALVVKTTDGTETVVVPAPWGREFVQALAELVRRPPSDVE
jgi:hypothetical protein